MLLANKKHGESLQEKGDGSPLAMGRSLKGRSMSRSNRSIFIGDKNDEGKKDDNVVDADFEEVKEDTKEDKEKSA